MDAHISAKRRAMAWLMLLIERDGQVWGIEDITKDQVVEILTRCSFIVENIRLKPVTINMDFHDISKGVVYL